MIVISNLDDDCSFCINVETEEEGGRFVEQAELFVSLIIVVRLSLLQLFEVLNVLLSSVGSLLLLYC